MGDRAEQVNRTRGRIVEATVHLHATIGLAATTVAGIAQQAGVTRLTVYRHFPDVEELFAACKEHWSAQSKVWSELLEPVGATRYIRDAEGLLVASASGGGPVAGQPVTPAPPLGWWCACRDVQSARVGGRSTPAC